MAGLCAAKQKQRGNCAKTGPVSPAGGSPQRLAVGWDVLQEVRFQDAQQMCPAWGRRWCGGPEVVQGHWTLGCQPSPGRATSLSTPRLQLRSQRGPAFGVRAGGAFKIKMHSNNRSPETGRIAGDVTA